MHCGQRLAARAMLEQQNGHSLLVGPASGTGGATVSLFTALTSKKMQKAMMTKLMQLLRNSP